MLKVKQFPFNPFGVSTFVVYDPDSRRAIIVDPGMVSDSEKRTLDNFIAENKLSVKQIVNTHLHVDHCLGNQYVADKYNAPVSANKNDEFLGKLVSQQAAAFGLFTDGEIAGVSIDRYLSDGDIIKVGDAEIHVLEVPGHSPGSICLYYPEGGWVIAGDTLFKGSMGRTDLPGGDFNTLVTAIKNKLLTLPDNTLVLPGHGPATTVRAEKANFLYY